MDKLNRLIGRESYVKYRKVVLYSSVKLLYFILQVF